MKLVAFITKTSADNKAEIALNFYEKSRKKDKYHMVGKNELIQVKAILPINNWDDLYKSTYLPSSDSFFLDTSYSTEINSAAESLIDDALKLMTSQQRYEFFEELFKSINIGEKPWDINSFTAEELCYIESPWARVNGNRVISPLKVFQRINPINNNGLQEFVCLTHNCIVTKEKIRKLFYKEAFGNESNPSKIKKFLEMINFLNTNEISELIDFVPETSDIAVAANFIIPILENCSVDFNNPLWSKVVDYIYSQRLLVIKRLAETIDLDDVSEIVYVLNKYLDLIPVKNHADVFMLLEKAPLPSSIKSASQFINCIIKSKYFNPESHIWDEMINYIAKYKNFCIDTLNKTNNLEEYNLILEASLNNSIWKNGVFEFREILIGRIENQSAGDLDEVIQKFILNCTCRLFPDAISVNITERLIKHFSSHYHSYKKMSSENQLQLFNIYSAITCKKILLNEGDAATNVAINYANERMTETMRSVKWDAEKALKKSALMLKRNEHRAVAALINKIVTDLNSYFSKTTVAEIYSALLLPQNPNFEWVALCEILPSIHSNFFIREELARYFISTGDVVRAKPHVAAIMSFEPNSKIATELHSLLSRETAVKALAEDGVDAETLDKLTGVEFEKILVKKLQKIGFKVMETPASGDYGADIIIDDEDGTRFIIQCKRFSSKVNLKAVQEIVAAMKHYNADYAIVATNNEFLKSAIELAKSNDVELWAGTKIMQVLSGDITETILAKATLHHFINE